MQNFTGTRILHHFSASQLFKQFGHLRPFPRPPPGPSGGSNTSPVPANLRPLPLENPMSPEAGCLVKAVRVPCGTPHFVFCVTCCCCLRQILHPEEVGGGVGGEVEMECQSYCKPLQYQWPTPCVRRLHTQSFPQRCSTPPGGVLIHTGGGGESRDPPTWV